MSIEEIQRMPTCFTSEGRNIHESVLKSFQIVEKVTEMLERKDSPETILEVMYICKRQMGKEFYEPKKGSQE